MAEKSLLLSALVVVGPLRKRSQRVLDALCSQTAIDSMEIVILDLAPDGTPKLETSSSVNTIYIVLPETEPWSRARAEGVRRAKAPIVAFIEDHCIPAPEWAEGLIEAHKGPWATVGYAFANANPETYVSRACFIADYGLWAHPARHGPARHLPG